jgi:predicted porin
MKKSLLALAVLGAFAGAASAQSSVTVYGIVDVSAQKNLGTKDKTIADDILGSRLGFRGVEDLGGGLSATFGMEHRFNPGTGAANATFWQGYSKAGIKGDFGHIELGRDYAVNFLMVQNQIDPFGGATVAILRDVAMRAGGIVASRYASQVEYHLSANGFNFGAQLAGSNENAGTQRAYSLAGNYAAGPLFVAAGYQRDANKAKIADIGARYNLGVATLVAGYSSGTTSANVKQKGTLVGAIVPMGSGNLKLGLGRTSNSKANKMGAGYDYLLSKRTTVFADIARDSKFTTEKSAYDLGIKHTF